MSESPRPAAGVGGDASPPEDAAYQEYHRKVVDAIVAELFSRWPPRTQAELQRMVQNVRFFDEHCDYREEFREEEEPSEVATNNIEAAS